MTPAPESTPHPEVAEISDLTEDLLTPERAAEVRLHLAECPLCADVLASLTEISSLLGELPPEEPIPADVAARIDATLAAEAARDASDRPEAPQRDVPRGTSSSGASRVPRETSLPASAPAPAGRPAAGTGPGRSDLSGRRRRRAFTLAAGWAVGVLALGGILYGVVSAGGDSPNSDASASRVAGAKRSDSTPVTGSIADQVQQLLTAPYSPNGVSGGTTMAPNHDDTPMLNGSSNGAGSTPRQGQSQGVTDAPSCVLKATHRTETPLAVGKDQYQGTDSYLVVLPHPADGSLADAYVVNASCSAGAPGTVLFQGTYPRR